MSQKSKTLLVGINDYSPTGIGGPDLMGCLNDIEDMTQALVVCGFQPASMKILTDQEATRDNILDGLQWLLKDNAAGDALVFYFSGHGSFRLDTDGDESDGMDEGICPYEPLKFISDDVLRDLFNKLQPGVNLDVFLDCCFSGTGTRLRPEGTVRYMPQNMSACKRSIEKLKRSAKKLKRSIMATPPVLNHTLWAACESDKTSVETNLDQKVRGVFTHFLTTQLVQAGGNITRADLYAQVLNALQKNSFSQVPQLETADGNTGKFIFS